MQPEETYFGFRLLSGLGFFFGKAAGRARRRELRLGTETAKAGPVTNWKQTNKQTDAVTSASTSPWPWKKGGGSLSGLGCIS